jgi:hypothetical protein
MDARGLCEGKKLQTFGAQSWDAKCRRGGNIVFNYGKDDAISIRDSFINLLY